MNGNITRIHVHSDKPFMDMFLKSVLPYFQSLYASTGRGILLHTGMSDNYCNNHQLLDMPVIKRWVMEQNRNKTFIHHPKVVQLPIGLCARKDNSHINGTDLRIARNESCNDRRRQLQSQSQQEEKEKEKEKEEEPSLLQWKLMRQLSEMPKKKWIDRKNKIYFCFSPTRDNRKVLMDFAKSGNCSFCEFCPEEIEKKYLPHLEVWKRFSEYKFVVSPWGNGPDCFRSWEILVLGSISVIEYFAGAEGYVDGGLSAILVQNTSDFTQKNMDKWLQQYNSSNEVYKLKREYWNKRAFDIETVAS